MTTRETLHKNSKNLSPSSSLEVDKYSDMIYNLKKCANSEDKCKDIMSFFGVPTFYYGLCDYGIQSNTTKQRCPFDIRQNFTTFKDRKFVTSTNYLHCYEHCTISREMQRCGLRLEDMENIPEEYHEVFKKLIKRTLGETFIKF